MRRRRQRGRADINAKRVVGYIRVSTEEQATEGQSLGAQESRLRKYCDLHGLTLVEVIADAGVSGATPLHERPEGHRVLDMVREQEVGVVLAVKLDRLFRSAADCLNVTAEWDKVGTALHLIDLGGQSFNTRSSAGRFFMTVMAGAAELERNQIGDRVRAVLASRREKGLRVGRVPFGWRVEQDGKLEVDHNERRTIKRALVLREKGWSQQRIADDLNAKGMHTRDAKGAARPWSQSSVCRLLQREQDRARDAA